MLAARGAQRAQPGLVTLFTQENVYHAVASQLQSAMVNVWTPDIKLFGRCQRDFDRPRPGRAGFAGRDESHHPAALARLRELPVIVDASALDWLRAAHAGAGNAIRVITPHPGEAARMLNTTVPQVQANRRAGRARNLAALRQLLGGAERPPDAHWPERGRRIFVNSSGNPHLAQGGSGDVLAGFIAGLLAQPALQADVGKTHPLRRLAARRGGGQIAGKRANWVVEDLPGELGNVTQ